MTAPGVEPLPNLDDSELEWKRSSDSAIDLVKSLPEVRDAHLHGTRGEDQQGIDIHIGLVDAEPGGRLDAGQIERLAALRAKLEAIVEGAPDVSEQDLVDEILSRRQG